MECPSVHYTVLYLPSPWLLASPWPAFPWSGPWCTVCGPCSHHPSASGTVSSPAVNYLTLPTARSWCTLIFSQMSGKWLIHLLENFHSLSLLNDNEWKQSNEPERDVRQSWKWEEIGMKRLLRNSRNIDVGKDRKCKKLYLYKAAQSHSAGGKSLGLVRF